MPDKVRYVGPSGAVFVPSSTIDEQTINARLESGEWTRYEEPKLKRARAPKPADD